MKIGIVGSRMVGSTAAYALVMRGIGREVVLADENEACARAEAEDILHAVPYAHPLRVVTGDYDARSGLSQGGHLGLLMERARQEFLDEFRHVLLKEVLERTERDVSFDRIVRSLVDKTGDPYSQAEKLSKHILAYKAIKRDLQHLRRGSHEYRL